MKEIPLTQGKIAIVDDEDFEYLSQWKWLLNNSGYALRYAYDENKNRKGILMHRLIMNTPKGMDTDHINGNGLDNRRRNLRVCTHKENLTNQGTRKNNVSGYKGVHWHKQNKKWIAQIHNNGKSVHLGCFDNVEDAAKTYDSAACKIYGLFSNLNFK